MAIKEVYFCLQTKQEVELEKIDEYLRQNPTHHLVECVRTDTVDGSGAEPAVEHLVSERDDQAITDIREIIDSGGSVGGGGGGDDHIILTWGESVISRRDWVQIHGASDTRAGNVVPFDGKIVGITLSYKRIRYGNQTVRLYIGNTFDSVLAFESHWLQQTNWDDTHATMGLDIPVRQGELIRARGGDLNGWIEKSVLGVIIKKG